ncbi:MAG: transposase, partial [Bdellovibrionales bacterium]|nr:transposase [Bdellovibrionales bacterium]
MEGKTKGAVHVARQQESGLSVREYCRQEGIPYNSFYNWKSKAKRESGFVKVSPASSKIELEL